MATSKKIIAEHTGSGSRREAPFQTVLYGDVENLRWDTEYPTWYLTHVCRRGTDKPTLVQYKECHVHHLRFTGAASKDTPSWPLSETQQEKKFEEYNLIMPHEPAKCASHSNELLSLLWEWRRMKLNVICKFCNELICKFCNECRTLPWLWYDLMVMWTTFLPLLRPAVRNFENMIICFTMQSNADLAHSGRMIHLFTWFPLMDVRTAAASYGFENSNDKWKISAVFFLPFHTWNTFK